MPTAKPTFRLNHAALTSARRALHTAEELLAVLEGSTSAEALVLAVHEAARAELADAELPPEVARLLLELVGLTVSVELEGGVDATRLRSFSAWERRNAAAARRSGGAR